MTEFALSALSRSAMAAMLALSLGACVSDSVANRGVESVHQPVVSTTSFVYDVRAGLNGDLTRDEAQRLEGWLSSIGVGYGDDVALAGDGAYIAPGIRDGIAAVVGRHGLLLGEDNSAQAGHAPDGSVRLILRRSLATVPGCPDWSKKQETDGIGATSSNFGCGINSNIAAMVANPQDLVGGKASDSDLRTATSDRAIKAYRDKEPTGAGDLKTISAGGN